MHEEPARTVEKKPHAAATEDRELGGIRRRRKFVARNLSFLRFVADSRPVPLAWWRMVRAFARRIASGPDALTLSPRRYVRRGAALVDEELRALLAPDVLGEFTLDARSFDLLCRRFDVERPTAILQCGAGASTLAFASLARRRRADGGRCVVVAIEEGAHVRDAVISRLARAGLAAGVHVVHAPLDAKGRYRFDPVEIARLAGAKFDWVVVEGPIAPAGRRVHSLPDVAQLCADGASWFLDDAFRDAQLHVLASWAATAGIEVRGIHPLVGKGLATGRVRRVVGSGDLSAAVGQRK